MSIAISRLPCPTCQHTLVSVVKDGASWYECRNCGQTFLYRSSEENRLLLDEIRRLIRR